jgi:hypothetical protein
MRGAALFLLGPAVERIEPERGDLLVHPGFGVLPGARGSRVAQVQVEGRWVVEVVGEGTARDVRAAVHMRVAAGAEQSPHPPGKMIMIYVGAPLLAARVAERPELSRQSSPQPPQSPVASLVSGPARLHVRIVQAAVSERNRRGRDRRVGQRHHPARHPFQQAALDDVAVRPACLRWWLNPVPDAVRPPVAPLLVAHGIEMIMSLRLSATGGDAVSEQVIAAVIAQHRRMLTDPQGNRPFRLARATGVVGDQVVDAVVVEFQGVPPQQGIPAMGGKVGEAHPNSLPGSGYGRNCCRTTAGAGAPPVPAVG